MRVSLPPGAEQDLEEAAAFYEREGSPTLAARFVAEFKKLSTLLVDHPTIGALRSKGRRGLSMSAFPYTVIYPVSSEEIRILVLKHHHRRPGFGGRRA